MKSIDEDFARVIYNGLNNNRAKQDTRDELMLYQIFGDIISADQYYCVISVRNFI